jgi:hypothetical protein
VGYYIRFRDRPLSLEEVMAGLRPVDGGLPEDEIEEFREEAADAGGRRSLPGSGAQHGPHRLPSGARDTPVTKIPAQVCAPGRVINAFTHVPRQRRPRAAWQASRSS